MTEDQKNIEIYYRLVENVIQEKLKVPPEDARVAPGKWDLKKRRYPREHQDLLE